MKTVCVDLDGTLAHYDKGWQGAMVIGDVFEGAKEFMQALKDEGYHINIFSSRVRNEYDDDGLVADEIDVQQAVKKWLNKHSIVFDTIYLSGDNGGKPWADAYIDDRAVVCAPQNSPPALSYAQAFKATLELSGEDAKTALPKAQKLLGTIRELGGKIHRPPQTSQSEHGEDGEGGR